jgi:ATP-binding cassette subfamily C exporter for protease/lipase
VQQVIGVWKSYSNTRSAYERLTKLLSDNPARPVGMELPQPQGVMTIEGVTAAPPNVNVAVLKVSALRSSQAMCWVLSDQWLR